MSTRIFTVYSTFTIHIAIFYDLLRMCLYDLCAVDTTIMCTKGFHISFCAVEHSENEVRCWRVSAFSFVFTALRKRIHQPSDDPYHMELWTWT
jgi:hypothetical protein